MISSSKDVFFSRMKKRQILRGKFHGKTLNLVSGEDSPRGENIVQVLLMETFSAQRILRDVTGIHGQSLVISLILCII